MLSESDAQTGQEGQDESASSQQPMTDGPEGPQSNARDMVPRAELDKVIRQRQIAKQRARDAERQLAAAREKLPNTPPADDGGPKEDGDADDGERDRDYAPGGDAAMRLQNTRLIEDLRSREKKLASVLRDQQLYAAAVAAGAVSPSQIVELLRTRMAMEALPDGEFAPSFLDEGGRPLLDTDGPVSDVDAFVTSYLSHPSNANLVRSSSVPGSGAKPAGGSSNLVTEPCTLAEFNALPLERRREVALKMSKHQREAMLGISPPTHGGYL